MSCSMDNVAYADNSFPLEQPLMEGDLVDVSKAVTSYGGLDRSLVRRWVAQLVSSPLHVVSFSGFPLRSHRN